MHETISRSLSPWQSPFQSASFRCYGIFIFLFFLLPKSKAEFDQQVGFVPGFASCRYRSQESKRSERSLFFLLPTSTRRWLRVKNIFASFLPIHLDTWCLPRLQMARIQLHDVRLALTYQSISCMAFFPSEESSSKVCQYFWSVKVQHSVVAAHPCGSGDSKVLCYSVRPPRYQRQMCEWRINQYVA